MRIATASPRPSWSSASTAFLPGRALADIAALLRAAEPEKALAVEVDGVEEAVETAEAGFDVIQLENSPPRRSPRSPPG